VAVKDTKLLSHTPQQQQHRGTAMFKEVKSVLSAKVYIIQLWDSSYENSSK